MSRVTEYSSISRYCDRIKVRHRDGTQSRIVYRDLDRKMGFIFTTIRANLNQQMQHFNQNFIFFFTWVKNSNFFRQPFFRIENFDTFPINVVSCGSPQKKKSKMTHQDLFRMFLSRELPIRALFELPLREDYLQILMVCGKELLRILLSIFIDIIHINRS